MKSPQSGKADLTDTLGALSYEFLALECVLLFRD